MRHPCSQITSLILSPPGNGGPDETFKCKHSDIFDREEANIPATYNGNGISLKTFLLNSFLKYSRSHIALEYTTNIDILNVVRVLRAVYIS